LQSLRRPARALAPASTLLALVLTLSPGVASAQDASAKKAAMGALDMARHFYKKGDYRKAAQLFHQAYGFDPIPDFLFNAARAEQRAFMLDESKRDFDKFLTLPDASEQAQRRARTHLKEIKESQAHYAEVSRRKAEEAAKKVKQAQAAESAKKAAAARREAARKAKEEAARKKAAAKAAGASGAAVGVKKAPQAGEWKTPAGWAGLGLGVAAITTGALLWATAASDQADLDEAASKPADDGLIHSVDWKEYEERRLDNSSSRRMGVIALSAGAALASAGAWLLMTAPEHRKAWRLRAGPRRIALQWHF